MEFSKHERGLPSMDKNPKFHLNWYKRCCAKTGKHPFFINFISVTKKQNKMIRRSQLDLISEVKPYTVEANMDTPFKLETALNLITVRYLTQYKNLTRNEVVTIWPMM